MAESKKSKNMAVTNYENFGYLLPKIRNAIEAKIVSALSVSLDVALTTYSGYLSSEIPWSIWNKLFQADLPDTKEASFKNKDSESKTDERSAISIKPKPKGSESSLSNSDNNQQNSSYSETKSAGHVRSQLSTDNLSLQELIMICQTLPPLKKKLSQEDKETLDRLQDQFQEVQIEFLLSGDVSSKASKEQKGRYQSIEAKLATILDDLGPSNDGTKEAKSWSAQEFLECPQLFHDQVMKTIARKMQSGDDSHYSDNETEKLQQLVKVAKEQKAQSVSKSESIYGLRTALVSAFQHALTCGYCHRMPKEPRTLPCLHVCCSACLKSKFAENAASTTSTTGNPADKQTLTCPQCHTRISMPSAAHVDQLPHGFVAETLLKLHELAKKQDEHGPECFFCINSPTHVCLLCSEFYCPDHTSTYYSPANAANAEPRQSHAEMIIRISTMAAADQVSSLLYRFCPQHRQRLSHFCSGCRVPLCSHMLCVDWHSQHVDPSTGLRPIDEVVLEEKQKLADIENLLCKKAEKIRNKIDLVEKNQITVAEVQENVRHSIEKYFKDIDEKLKIRKAAFLSDLDKAAAQCFQNDETIHSRLQNWAEKTETLDAKFRQYFDSGDNASNADSATIPELASLHFQILQQLNDACTGALAASAKRLSYPETRLRELQHSVGTMQSNITTASAGRGWESVIKFTTGITPSSIGTPVHFAIDNLKSVAYVIKSRGLVAMAQILSYDLRQTENREPTVVCDGGARNFETLTIDAHSRRLFAAEQPQSNLELPAMRLKKSIPVRVYDINTIGTVTLTRTSALEHLNTFSKSIIKYASNRLYICDGVCVCEYEIASEFKLIRKFNFHNMLEIADFAVEPKRDFLYVIDCKKHCLLLFNCRHQVVKSIGEQGVTPGKFDQPSGVSLDEFGHVFVADAGNFRVQIFDVEGKFLRLIQYPHVIKDISQSLPVTSDHKSGAASTQAKVALQAGEDCLYMLDSRSEHLWRYRYM